MSKNSNNTPPVAKTTDLTKNGGKPDEAKETPDENTETKTDGTTAGEGGESGNGNQDNAGGDKGDGESDPAAAASTPAAPAVAQAPATTPLEPSMAPDPTVVKAEDQVNGRGTATTDILVSRVNRHFDWLAGRLRIDTKKARDQEQSDFMDTIGNSLKLDYREFKLVTDVLLAAIRKDLKTFTDGGQAFRFIPGMEPAYAPEYVAAYQTYITFLTRVAKNWARRHDAAKMSDITTVIEGFPTKGRANVTQYFNELAAK